MVEKKNFFRTIYEKFNLNIYIIVPLIVLLLYFVSDLLFGFNLADIKTYNENKIEISITISGILLTIMGLFTSLPNTKFRELMKKYNHDKIVNRTLLIGVLSSIFTVILSVSEKLIIIESALFIIGITETIIASIWLYKTLMHIND